MRSVDIFPFSLQRRPAKRLPAVSRCWSAYVQPACVWRSPHVLHLICRAWISAAVLSRYMEREEMGDNARGVARVRVKGRHLTEERLVTRTLALHSVSVASSGSSCQSDYRK